MLIRLDEFKIDINHGERVYTCINSKYLLNNNLKTSVDNDNKTLNTRINQALKYGISLNKILSFKKQDDANNHLTYENILQNYLEHKYKAHAEYHQNIENLKEKRIGKMLNLFFYTTLIQVTTLNLCTFVFFNWDIMEPITTCITYLNFIAGYYFWAFTHSDYEIHSISQWIKEKKIFKNSLNCLVMEEREEIINLLDNNKI